MRIGRNSRNLSGAEKNLATTVFGGSLPHWDKIWVDDGLGLQDRQYTMEAGPFGWAIHMGPTGYPDCTSRTTYQGDRIDVIFIHEMTHIWQYGRGQFVVASSLWAQTLGDGYSYTAGDPWDDYNAEQQASIVENWYLGGMSTTVPEFQYVNKVVRRSGANSSLSLLDLTSVS